MYLQGWLFFNSMEILLHYVWKHKLFPLKPLQTTDGQVLEVIDPGLHNTDSGPDFFNAKVKIGGTLWVGNVEIHDHASDWYAHHHDTDLAYSNVILHVAQVMDAEVCRCDGTPIAQLQLDVPTSVMDNYNELLAADKYPPCHRLIARLSPLLMHSWLTSLQMERLEQKTLAIDAIARRHQGDWEQAFFVTMARNYGFGINGDAFEQWAESFSLSVAGKHRENEFQIEALFMGQAGLLDEASLPVAVRQEALADAHYQRLAAEYRFLQHKYALQPIPHHLWRFLRLRPQNFPHIRISQLVRLYCSNGINLSTLVDCQTIEAINECMHTQVTDYWTTHYAFGQPSARSDKHLSPASLRLLVINTAVPVLFAYGRHLTDEKMCERAVAMQEQVKAEDNHIVRMWQECGLKVEDAAQSQALIQLKRRYCDRKDCLRCRIGYEYLKNNSKQ